MMIQAVFFDMGGTIETYSFTRQLRLQATPGIQQRLLSAGIDLHLNNMELFDLISTGLKNYHNWCVESLDEYSSRMVWRDYILKNFSIDFTALDEIAEDLMLYIETQYYQRDMRFEIPDVLKTIQQMGLKIGMISNVNSKGQVPTNLKKYGIIDYFYPIVLSSQYGRRKPDPAIFHYAARLANVPTSECVYIGDRVSRDIVGARKAGFRVAVQIHHNFKHGEDDSGAEPDAIIDNMTELLDILKNDRGSVNAAIRKKSQIRAILFDAGDILYFRPQKGKYFNEFLAEHNLPKSEIIEVEIIALRDQAFQGLISQYQRRSALLHLYGITDPDLIALGHQAIQKDEENIQFFEEVQETLIALKESGFMLGIITDTANPVHVKLSWFERGGFGNVWDSIISSQEVGIEKPDPEIYMTALQQLGLKADQAFFVGHCTEELEGARNCGMKTIAFNYEAPAKADYYIENFADLLQVPLLV